MINNVIISLSVKGKVVLPWKMNLPHESQLASKPHFFTLFFLKYIVVMTESVLLHPVYQQEAFLNILCAGSPWFASTHINDGFETRRQINK